MEGINVGFGVHFDDPFGNDDGTNFVCSTNTAEENGKQVMEANKLSKALERRWEM